MMSTRLRGKAPPPTVLVRFRYVSDHLHTHSIYAQVGVLHQFTEESYIIVLPLVKIEYMEPERMRLSNINSTKSKAPPPTVLVRFQYLSDKGDEITTMNSQSKKKAAVEIDFVVLKLTQISLWEKPKSTNIQYSNLVIYYVHLRRNDRDVNDKMRFNTIRR